MAEPYSGSPNMGTLGDEFFILVASVLLSAVNKEGAQARDTFLIYEAPYSMQTRGSMRGTSFFMMMMWG